MPDTLFDRRCRLTIATPVASATDFNTTTTNIVEIDGGKTDRSIGMRIRFNIDKSLQKEPNTSTIVVSNLSPSHRSDLQQKGVKVLLEAGYKSTGLQRLTSSDVRTADHVRTGADWESTLKLGDGERAWRFARIDESFSPGTTAQDILKKIAAKTGLDVGNANDKAAKLDKIFDQGYVVSGGALRALDRFVTSLGKEWSIQDGALQILDPYENLDLPIPEITPDSGLIGSPEMGSPSTKGKPAMLTFKSLLVVVKPGGKVKLKSKRYDGYIRAHKVSFSGDSHGGDWYTTITGSVIK